MDSNQNQLVDNSIEVESMSEKEFQDRLNKAFSKTKQIVQIDKNLKSEEAPDLNSKEKIYLSSHNQRTDRNTRAAKIGEFKNVLNPGQKAQSNSKLSKLFEINVDENKKEKVEDTSNGTGVLRKPASIENKNGDGESATDDYLEDVAIGASTILNAQEYRFYGFYSRIREQVVQHWHQRLKIEIYKLDSEGRPIVNTQRKTQIRVYLTSAGQLQDVQVIGSSGLLELDRAATDSFKLAAPFPHPPKEMIGDDGLVPIRWEFIVVANDEAGVQFTVRRAGYR